MTTKEDVLKKLTRTDLKKIVIAVDFDGTLAVTKWPELKVIEPKTIDVPVASLETTLNGDWDIVKSTIVLETVDIVKHWSDVGHFVILWTARSGKLLDEAVEWCLDRGGLKFDKINQNPRFVGGDVNRKIYVDRFVDDRGCDIDSPSSWDMNKWNLNDPYDWTWNYPT